MLADTEMLHFMTEIETGFPARSVRSTLGGRMSIAEAAAFLAGDLSRHMTGQTIHINGGRIMR
jgi:NAD(P)-dependent dehydrogenase (short-subunit alcohol dehydrogenase family)